MRNYLLFSSVSAVFPIKAKVEVELSGPKYDAYDLVKAGEKGVKQYLKVESVYYVNADTLDVACDAERVEWYKNGLKGEADLVEIDEHDGGDM